jgi:hypothetical protein
MRRDAAAPARLPFALVAAAVVSAVVGALLAYAFDPERGRGRRVQTLDRTAGSLRRTGRQAERLARSVGATAAGWGARASHLSGETEPVDDTALAHKVESKLFRDPDIPKGRINVNAENGLVVLRGVANDAAQIVTIEAKVRSIVGVRDVRNLLHLEGTPAPKEPA